MFEESSFITFFNKRKGIKKIASILLRKEAKLIYGGELSTILIFESKYQDILPCISIAQLLHLLAFLLYL